MGLSLNDLSGSTLRKLALSELKEFILLLDQSKTDELQRKKAYLSEIFARLTHKEQEELEHLIALVSNIGTSFQQQVPSAGSTIVHDINEQSFVFPSVSNDNDSDTAALQKSA